MPSTKAKAPEDSESLEKQLTIDAEPGADDESSSESDTDVPAAAASESGPSRPSKKKKKKRSKVARAISALKGDSVPQAVVDKVVAKVKEEHGEDSAAADEETVRALLKQLKLKDVAEGKAGLGGKNRKDTGDHKVRSLCGEQFRRRSGVDRVDDAVLGDTTCTSLRCVAYIPFVDLCSSVHYQTMKPQRKMGASSLLNPRKKSGRILSHFRGISNGVSSTSQSLLRFE